MFGAPFLCCMYQKQVGWSLLHHLARVGDHIRLLWLLHHGAEVDPVDRMGTTPLLLAAAKVTSLLCRRLTVQGWWLDVVSLMLGYGGSVGILQDV